MNSSAILTSSAVLTKGASSTFSNGWPYPPHTGASPRMRVYGPHISNKSALVSMGSPQTRISNFQRASEFEPSADGFPRQGGPDSIHYENEQGANYSLPSSYVIPNAPSGMVDYESSWSPKIWEPVMSMNRPASGGIYPEPDANDSMNQCSYNYMLPNQDIISNEVPQTTTAMAIASDVPVSDRILPTPSSRSQQTPSNPSMNAFAEGIPGLSIPSDFKGSFWTQRCTDQPQQRPHTLPSNVPFPNNTSTKCNSTNNAPDIIFPYMSLSSSDESTSLPSTAPTSTSSISSYTSLAVDSALETSSPEYRIPNNDNRAFSRETPSTQRLLSLSNECSPEIYGYTSSEKKTRPSDPTCPATLMNGLPYTRVRHTDPPSNVFPCGLLPENIQDYRSVGNTHRHPVPPLGNQGY